MPHLEAIMLPIMYRAEMLHLSLDLMRLSNTTRYALKVTDRRKWKFPSHGLCWDFVAKQSRRISPREPEPELESQLSIVWLASRRALVLPALVTALKGTDGICAASWVDLSLLASVSFAEQLWWRHNTTQDFPTFQCLFIYYMICFSQTPVGLFVSFGQDVGRLRRRVA